LEKEGVFLFYCMYLIKFAASDPVFWNGCKYCLG